MDREDQRVGLFSLHRLLKRISDLSVGKVDVAVAEIHSEREKINNREKRDACASVIPADSQLGQASHEGGKARQKEKKKKRGEASSGKGKGQDNCGEARARASFTQQQFE
jgi:hypothetical protein